MVQKWFKVWIRIYKKKNIPKSAYSDTKKKITAKTWTKDLAKLYGKMETKQKTSRTK